MSKISPSIESVAGFRAAGVHAGLKKDGALDFALIVSEADCVAAGVFTRNKVKAAPVLLDMERLANDAESIRAVATNTISANACTGAIGLQNARATSDLVAEALDIAAEQVLVMSTGVIGTHLPMDKIARGVDLSSANLGDDWRAAAAAIMTTDTRPKLGSVRVESDSGAYTLAGMVKGAGMIAPNMATMLSVIVTDAAISAEAAGEALRSATQESFNRIVVDGDTSTNDTVLLLANGGSGVAPATDQELAEFQTALTDLCRYLAQEVVRDGEGVTKFVTLDIINADSEAAAERIGQTIGASVLTKSAFYGSDANWGRIVAAAGRAGTAFNPDSTSLWVAAGESLPDDQRGLRIFSGGMPTDYQEADAAAIMAEPSITFTLDCGMGAGCATIWTCDISHDYISINGDYRS
ncbi:MAG: bifunctional glutamate N-acetyltransferase/amino-acid acetyltransferase ArgJ [Chloroflexi bacterium]|nr:bifunctional glutamate N-acetyltransferase/amino-acid acetyltransferase ArgJ [Chloroflexota bacterium]